MTLDDDEIKRVTKKTHRKAQRRVLIELGIEHLVRADGSLVVSRAHVEHLLGGGVRTTITRHEPDWSTVR